MGGASVTLVMRMSVAVPLRTDVHVTSRVTTVVLMVLWRVALLPLPLDLKVPLTEGDVDRRSGGRRGSSRGQVSSSFFRKMLKV